MPAHSSPVVQDEPSIDVEELVRWGCLEEDAGFLTTFVTSASGESRLMVYDAKTMDSAAVATVHIPCRVPLGFHGIHLTEEQLSMQRL